MRFPGQVSRALCCVSAPSARGWGLRAQRTSGILRWLPPPSSPHGTRSPLSPPLLTGPTAPSPSRSPACLPACRLRTRLGSGHRPLLRSGACSSSLAGVAGRAPPGRPDPELLRRAGRARLAHPGIPQRGRPARRVRAGHAPQPRSTRELRAAALQSAVLAPAGRPSFARRVRVDARRGIREAKVGWVR